MWFNQRQTRVVLDTDPERNVFAIKGEECFLENIDEIRPNAGGANSSVFRAIHHTDPDSYIVKFARQRVNDGGAWNRRRRKRFLREIRALDLVRGSERADCVIPMVESGVARMGGADSGVPYYVMEEAESDLRRYLVESDLSVPQRLSLCDQLVRILRDLHELGIYHRDIKPGNILIMNGRPVFGDLGLIAFRNEDQEIDLAAERIGPVGYMSPEATNKHLGLYELDSFDFDITIDDKSDVFQLGKVFWLILQGEVPVGHLEAEDAKPSHERMLLTVIHPMLQYRKARRASLPDVGTALAPVLRDNAVI